MNIRRADLILIISVLLIINTLLSACTGKRIIERQTEYHTEIYGLEEYLIDIYGEFYCIDEPDIDYDNQIVRIHCIFLTDYIENTEHDQTMLEVMEGTRVAVNLFLADNPDYFLNDGFIIRVFFFEYPESYSEPPIERGVLCNELYETYTPEPTLCYVKYPDIMALYSSSSVSFEGIREINLDYLYDADIYDVLKVLNSMPDLEIVMVRPTEFSEELSNRCPTLLFV